MDKTKKSMKKSKFRSKKSQKMFQTIETEEFYNKGFLVRKKIKTLSPFINPFTQFKKP